MVDGRIVADWGARVRRRFGERDGDPNNIDNHKLANNYNNNNYLTPVDRMKRVVYSPESDSSPERQIGYLNNLRSRANGDGGDDEPPEGNEEQEQEC